MMKTMCLRSKTALGLILGLSFCFSAQAADTWTYTGVDANGAGVDSASAGATSLTTTGAFATNVGTNGVSGNWSTNTSGTPSAALQFFSPGGLGMDSDGNTQPNHALDNNGVYTEAVLLNFGTSTILTGIDLGYVSGDADVSVFRYIGNTAPTLSSTGAALSSMQGAGWSLVGNYANLGADSSTPLLYNLINGATDSNAAADTVDPTASAGSVGSSWWLITAYNTAYGTGTGLTQGDDYFKLLAVAGSACTGGAGTTKCGSRVPEPGSLALVSLALFGAIYVRRQTQQRKD